MNKIRINAKSTPEYGEFLPKTNNGFHNIEIQLIHKYLKEQEYEDTKKGIENGLIDISVVHTPLVKEDSMEGAEEIPLMDLVIPKVYNMFDDTCKYAEFIAELENKRIKVVVHTINSKKDLIETKMISEKVGPLVKNTLDKYKDVDLVIENSTSTGERRFKTVFDMDDVAYAVKELNDFLGEKRAYPLMDTCHLMMNFEAWKRFSYEDLLNFDESFKKASEYGKLGLIHLNNMWDNGVDKDHGRPFDMNHTGDLEKLDKIMKAYEKYANCEITIEVAEDDYYTAPNNLIKTKESLEKLGYELDCGK